MLIKKFRYDFTDEVGNLLSIFSKEHENEKYKEFQKSWNEWTNKEEIKEILEKECDRLEKQGYENDVWDKMYKSARYYYKKKDSEKKEKIQSKHTNRFSTMFLSIIDEFIKYRLTNQLESENQLSLSQPESYNEFCISNKDHLLNEFKRLIKERGFIPENIEAKLKKTYKNRFHLIRNKIVNSEA